MTMLTNDHLRSAENAVLSQQALRALDTGSKAPNSKAPLVITEGVQPRVPLVRVDAGAPNSATSTFTTVRFDSFDKTCQIKKLDACIAGKLGKLSEDNPKIRLEKTLIELASTPDDRARHSAHYELFALANACFQSPEKSIEMRLPVLLQHIATEVLNNLENLLEFRTKHPELFTQCAESNQEKLLASIFQSVHVELMTRRALQVPRQDRAA